MKKLKIIIPIFLILLVTLVSFYPSLKNAFTNWDDNLYVTENKAIRSVSLANLKNICTSFFVTHYQPVTIFSYLLEYRFFKLNPFNYHLTNLLLHLLNCLLVFWVIYLLSSSIPIAGLTAMLFGIHPMQVESVAWISERKNLLYAFFYLGAIASYLYYLRQDRRIKYFILCLGLFVLSLLSKSMAMTLPLVLLLLDYFTSRKINRMVFIEKIPYFFLSLVCGQVAFLGGHLSQAFYIERSYSLFTKIMGISGDIVFYLNKLLFPIKLSVLYPYSEINHNPFYLISLIIVITLVVLVILSGRYSKKVIFGSGLFFLIIFPAIRSLPVDEILAADRYVYLSAIGIFYLIAEGCLWLYRRKIKYCHWIRAFLLIALAAVVIFLGHSSYKRSQIWKDSLSLWNDVLEKYPDIFLAYEKRGEYFLSQKKYEKACSDFMMAVDISNRYPFEPKYKDYYLNLSYSLRALGKNSEAIAVSQELMGRAQAYFDLIKIKHPTGDQDEVIAANRKAVETEVYFNLAYINDALWAKNKALALYLKVIETYPKNVNALFSLGVLYANLNRPAEAQAQLLKAIEIDPAYTPAYIKLAQVYRALGQEEALRPLYQKAIANNLDFFEAYHYMGNLLADTQKEKDAILLYLRAIEINPSSKETCVGLGNAYLTIGKDKEAIAWLQKALELDPNLSVAHHNLALAYYYAQEYGLAIKHCDQAIKLGYQVTPKLLKLLAPHKK